MGDARHDVSQGGTTRTTTTSSHRLAGQGLLTLDQSTRVRIPLGTPSGRRGWVTGITEVQILEPRPGAIPGVVCPASSLARCALSSTLTSSRFSGEGRGLQNRGSGSDSRSALHSPPFAAWSCERHLCPCMLLVRQPDCRSGEVEFDSPQGRRRAEESWVTDTVDVDAGRRSPRRQRAHPSLVLCPLNRGGSTMVSVRACQARDRGSIPLHRSGSSRSLARSMGRSFNRRTLLLQSSYRGATPRRSTSEPLDVGYRSETLKLPHDLALFGWLATRCCSHGWRVSP